MSCYGTHQHGARLISAAFVMPWLVDTTNASKRPPGTQEGPF